MAWSAPSTQSAGDLITTTIWNKNTVTNVEWLHDRKTTTITAHPYDTTMAALGDFITGQVSSAVAYWNLHIPDDFSSLDEAVIVYVCNNATPGTLQFDITSDYGAAGQAYTTHSESALNVQVTPAQNILNEYDFSGILTSLAAGDYVGIKFSMDSIGAGGAYGLHARITYTRT